MPVDDFTQSVPQNVDTDLAIGRAWSVGLHAIRSINAITAVASGTAASLTLKIGRESIPIPLTQGATVDTDVNVIDINKAAPINLVNLDPQAMFPESIQLIARNAGAAANFRVRIIYD